MRARGVAAAGAAAPPTSSATEVATTAVLAPAAGLQLAALRQAGPNYSAGAPSSGDDSKAAQLRQPLLSDIASHEIFFLLTPVQVRLSRACSPYVPS